MKADMFSFPLMQQLLILNQAIWQDQVCSAGFYFLQTDITLFNLGKRNSEL